jgi:hypothetical protein
VKSDSQRASKKGGNSNFKKQETKGPNSELALEISQANSNWGHNGQNLYKWNFLISSKAIFNSLFHNLVSTLTVIL